MLMRPASRAALIVLSLGVGVLVGGLAGLVMAAHGFDGLASRLGFAALALAWLYTGARAYAFIAWLSWPPNLVVAEIIVARRKA